MEEDEKATAALIASFTSQETFSCGVCMEDKLMEDVARIPECEHQYCRECLRDYLGSQLKDGAFPIMCPGCRAEKLTEPSSMCQYLSRA